MVRIILEMHAWSRLFRADPVSGFNANLRSLRDLNVSKALSFSPKLEPLLKVDHQGRQARSLSGSCPLELGCNHYHGSLQLSKDKQVDTVGILLTMAGKSQGSKHPVIVYYDCTGPRSQENLRRKRIQTMELMTSCCIWHFHRKKRGITSNLNTETFSPSS